MPKLTVQRGDTRASLDFSGTPLLADVLAAGGFAMLKPCGGRGTCAKCAVTSLTGAVSQPSEAELRAGARLGCQAGLLGDCAVVLPPENLFTAIETTAEIAALGQPMAGHYGAAVDLGTTTIVAKVFDLQTGQALGQRALLNPQTAVAADVMGRISQALDGGLFALRDQAQNAVLGAVAGACAEAGVPMAQAVTVAGNTTMLMLLTGRDPHSLAVAPFQADCLFGLQTELGGVTAYLPRCASAFVGADLTCAALATGLCDQPETRLLMDIGTNGELLLWHRGVLYAASTAAGPAFEGGEISQGCGGIDGAIDKVWVEGAGLGARVIGGGEAVGVCGSGLIDAVAVLLQLGQVDASGALDTARIPLRDTVSLTAGDVRAVQLAKAAIAAGVETLLAAAGATPFEVKRVELAGGFGSHLSVQSAAAIGLIPAVLASKARPVGNAALAGAIALLLDTRLRAKADKLANEAVLVPLGGDPGFEARFIAAMNFPNAQGDEEN